MRKAGVLSILFVVILLAVAVIAEAQQPAKVRKIGWLGTRSTSAGGQEVIRRILRDLGYVEGKNIAFEYRFADNKVDRLPALADELLRLKVDVLVTPGINEALVAKNATKTIPIVFFSGVDPVAAGLVDSLPRPGETSRGSPTLGRYWLASDWNYSRKPFPSSPALRCFGIHRIQALRNNGKKANWQHENWVCSFIPWKSAAPTNTRAHSKRLLRRVAPRSPRRQRNLANSNQKQIADLATKNRLPAIYPREDWVANGGLMSYGPDRDELYKRVASIVDKILKGAKPADLPVEQPTKFELIINLKAAKQIGLTIPPNVLVRADKVIK